MYAGASLTLGTSIDNFQVTGFITVGKTPHLNRKHTIFGEVKDAASQGVVDAIATTQTGAGDKPVKDVVINSVTVA